MLSAKERYCLEIVARRPCSTYDACLEALSAGLNTASLRFEWADHPFRSLRKKGLIERQGRRDGVGRSIHAVTAMGKEVLGNLALDAVAREVA